MSGASGAEIASPAELADLAAESVRALNHLTQPGSEHGYEWPADVDAVIANVQTLAARLVQALRQADHWITMAQAAGTVAHDRGADAAVSVQLLGLALVTAADDAARLAHSLGTARAESCHLTGITPPEATP
jgi:hypothetical protein